MMTGMFLGLLLGLVIGAGGCWLLMQRLHGLVINEAEAERTKIRNEGLEAARRIADASAHVHRAMLDGVLAETGPAQSSCSFSDTERIERALRGEWEG